MLLAPGVQYRKLDIPGADRLDRPRHLLRGGAGGGRACKDEDVFVVGGANSAGQAALHFAKFARKVTMLVRGAGLSATMSKYLIDEIDRTSNIVVETGTQVLEAEGNGPWRRCELRGPGRGDRRCRRLRCLSSSARHRAYEWLPPSILRDEKGFVLAGPDLRKRREVAGEWRETREPFLLETSVPGVFVAGDVRHGSMKRVASAVGEGSIAVQFAHQYLAGF